MAYGFDWIRKLKNHNNMKNKLIIFLSIALFTTSSCASLFNATVLPRQCKKCELFNRATGEKVWEVEGCGGENTDLEAKCKEKAWELSHGNHLCDFEYKCKTWRKKKEK